MKRRPPKNGKVTQTENVLLVDGNALYKRGITQPLVFFNIFINKIL